MDWKRIAASALMLGVLAVPASAASITPQTTMKEIRDDPDIKASGLYTYTYVWERDCEMFSTSRDDETLTEVVGETSAEACAAGLNYLAQVYHDGTRVTYPLYSEEEIAAVPARAHVELYYCPAQQLGAKFAIVLSGNSLYYSGELRGGVSTAWELHEQGCVVHSVVGFRSKDLLILEDEFNACSDELRIMTDDGSYGTKGVVTAALDELVAAGNQYDLVITIGPLIMMKFVCQVTKKYNIKTVVSMNPIMIDGTGMCGGCRVTVGGKIKYACVDGPDFDGHQVDFDELMRRNGTYKRQEQECNLFRKEVQ